WAFQVIIILSALPISFAGIGVREGAALVLLGLYGIPSATAVDASLLTLTAALFWALIGALLLWSEEARRRAPPLLSRGITVVIPTLNEATALKETVRQAQGVPEVSEIIVVDGGSHDGTVDLASELGCIVLVGQPGRGGQMRQGAAIA